MTVKRFSSYSRRVIGAKFTAIITSVIMAAACSDIAEDRRLIPTDTTVPTDTTEVNSNADLDSLYDAPADSVPRRLLIEDFTGQKCANCPDASDNIYQLQQIYGALIVPVAIQSEFMGIMEPEGLGNELGNRYFNAINLTPKVKPALQVSRFYGDVLTSNTDVNFYVENAIMLKTSTDIRLKTIQNADDHTKADIDVKVICTDREGTVSGNLQVWVVEDSIVAPQDYLNGQHFDDYVHNHVLRASANGDWGENIGTVTADEAKEFHYTVDLLPNWNVEHLAIVAFVYDSEQVAQVVRQQLRLRTGH